MCIRDRFDYAGTQACRALKEEGVEVVLVNSNPATIMTDKDIADVYKRQTVYCLGHRLSLLTRKKVRNVPT